MRLFPYLCCRYYFYFCPPSHKASNLERVRDWHSFRSSTTLTMLFKKTYDYDFVHAYASASVKSVVIILWLRDDILNKDKKFLAFIFLLVRDRSTDKSSLVQSITWDTEYHSLQNRNNFAAFFEANRGTKIDSVLQPNYVNSKQCRTSSVSTLSHLNLSRIGKNLRWLA